MSRPGDTAGPWRRVVLVGFMGAGKTSVGRALAARLGWRSLDLDEVIEGEAGRSIPRIFATDGEEAFRRMEHEIAGRLLAEERLVFSVGGGWAAAPGRLTGLPPDTASVWLVVTPEEAVRRAAAEPGRRPLLEVSDPLGRARDLLAERAPAYAAADFRVDTERSSVEDVTARILELLSADPPEPRTE